MPNIWKPEMPQLKWGKPNQFEGWYFKQVDATEENAIAVIPGVSFGRNEAESHCFVQVLDGRTRNAYYFPFPLEDFQSDKKHLRISIRDNEFRMDGIDLHLKANKHEISGSLQFGEIIPWPVSRFTPGAMGPFRFIPGMQCLHGILSFDHKLQGNVIIDNRGINFSNGRGYIEKDWGREFPSAWIWMQSNHFEEPGISFTASIANIPWMKRSFTGFLIGLLYNGTVYRFTTYTRAKISTPKVSEDAVTFTVQDKNSLIEVDAQRAHGAMLKSPEEGLMTGRIIESLDSSIQLKYFTKDKNRTELIFEGTGRNAGLEVVGNLSEIGAIQV
ncbi:MAG: tocopherol cyclase family protein [Candidatus Hermodarchaeota archaeon]|nr:tocopherol cyclase family protein [Candidatus Hermodarchaeota archaeon]